MESLCSDSQRHLEDAAKFSFKIDSHSQGLRLDHYLMEHLSEYSRSQISNSAKKGYIHVNGSPAKASRKLHDGDLVEGRVEEPKTLNLVAQKVLFDVLYEDEHLIGISKPPGLVVHPADGNPDNTLVNGLLYHYSKMADVGDPIRPGIVHRLDKDTSGAMVVAKNNEVHRQLVEIFKSRQIKKHYRAIVVGTFDEADGRVVAPLGRHPVNRKKMAVRERSGKYAASNWWLERTFGEEYSLVKIQIETGRTHQIRVHMASIGKPVAGDTVYGMKRKNLIFPRQMLHSSDLQFAHPVTGRKLRLHAPLWPDIVETIEKIDLDQGDV